MVDPESNEGQGGLKWSSTALPTTCHKPNNT